MKAIGDKKYCPSCNKTKSIFDFGKCNSRPDGLKVYCKQCRNEKHKEYYYSDIEDSRKRGRKKARKHRQNPEVALQNNIKAKDWYHNNKKWAIKRRRNWRKTMSGRLSVIKSNQKRNRNSKVDLSLNEIEFLLILQNNECARCGIEFGDMWKNRYTLDHIIPLSLGGKLVLKNTQLLCRSCNSSKNDKIIMYRPNINFNCLNFI